MRAVLGLPLAHAADLLAADGFRVAFEEVRSKKGVPDGDSKRVIGIKPQPDGAVLLQYALFLTTPKQ